MSNNAKKAYFLVYAKTFLTPGKKIHFAQSFQKLIMMPLAIF